MPAISPPPDSETAAAGLKREKPLITEEEDRPLEETTEIKAGSLAERPTVRTIEEQEQTHKHKVEDYKNIVGGLLLAVCLAIIVGFSIADAKYQVESALFSNAFEFAKTIATAVIGYLFATNAKK